MHFMFRKGWHCQFLEEDMKTPLPRTLTFADDRKIWEMAKRGGFTLNIAGRQEIEAALRKRGKGESGWILRASNIRSCDGYDRSQ
jgi:hypothetical protein